MAEQPFIADNVTSLAEAIVETVGALTPARQEHLSLWLPELTVPPGWQPASGAATRILLRKLNDGDHWDGCEVLNLYRVAGAVPESLVLVNADRTLRDSGARDIQVMRVDTPGNNVVATRAAGSLQIGTRTVRAHYNNHVVNTPRGAALIEQVVLVGAEVHGALSREIAELTSAVYKALLTSLGSAANTLDIDKRDDVRRDAVTPLVEPSLKTVHRGER